MTAISGGDRIVVSVRVRRGEACSHTSLIELDDGTLVTTPEAMRQMQEYGVRYRRARATEPLKVGPCPNCGERVLG